jgi:hypothetical protein
MQLILKVQVLVRSISLLSSSREAAQGSTATISTWFVGMALDSRVLPTQSVGEPISFGYDYSLLTTPRHQPADRVLEAPNAHCQSHVVKLFRVHGIRLIEKRSQWGKYETFLY